jgi:hypothetical protein
LTISIIAQQAAGICRPPYSAQARAIPHSRQRRADRRSLQFPRPPRQPMPRRKNRPSDRGALSTERGARLAIFAQQAAGICRPPNSRAGTRNPLLAPSPRRQTQLAIPDTAQAAHAVERTVPVTVEHIHAEHKFLLKLNTGPRRGNLLLARAPRTGYRGWPRSRRRRRSSRGSSDPPCC